MTSIYTVWSKGEESKKKKALQLLTKPQLRNLLRDVKSYYDDNDSKMLLVESACRLPLRIQLIVSPIDKV